MRATWLADVLRDAGLTVVEMDGWETRGGELSTIRGVVAHHTATSVMSSDSNVARLLRDGRSDLKGPLAQLGLDRSGRFWLVASGRCSHNGHGEWGNQSIGIEAFNNGTGEMWPELQLDAFRRGTAAILRKLGLSACCVKAHRETDPRRKTDPAGVSMSAFRDEVARLMRLDHPEVLMRDERLIVVPAPTAEGRQLVAKDKDGNPLGKWTATSSVQVCASASGDLTRLIVQPTRYGDDLVLAVAMLDGSAAPEGAQARVLIEHR